MPLYGTKLHNVDQGIEITFPIKMLLYNIRVFLNIRIRVSLSLCQSNLKSSLSRPKFGKICMKVFCPYSLDVHFKSKVYKIFLSQNKNILILCKYVGKT